MLARSTELEPLQELENESVVDGAVDVYGSVLNVKGPVPLTTGSLGKRTQTRAAKFKAKSV